MMQPHAVYRNTLPALFLAGHLISGGCGDSRPEPESPAVDPVAAPAEVPWTESEITLFESLSIIALPPPPPQPSNRVANDHAAAELGHHLFFDPRLSRDGTVSCATCHVAGMLFTDGRTTSRGLASTSRNAPTLVGSAHSPWQFWGGRRDSLWAQALGPLESAAEMGSTRMAVVRHVFSQPSLAEMYGRVFGNIPVLDDVARFAERAGPFGDASEQDAWYRMAEADRRTINVAFANIGKAIAAYERLLAPGPSRFDRYVENLRTGSPPAAETSLSEEEVRGLRLFIDAGRTLCLRCHNGPLFTSHVFHDIGTAAGPGRLPDFGRFLGMQAVLIDPFNCLGRFSDAAPNECRELRFLDKSHAGAEMGKFKTPTLRGLSRTAPYMHDGRFATLEEVIEHYRSPPAGANNLEITPLEIDVHESRALVAFLTSLDGGVDLADAWLRPPSSRSAAQTPSQKSPDPDPPRSGSGPSPGHPGG